MTEPTKLSQKKKSEEQYYEILESGSLSFIRANDDMPGG